MKTGSSHKSIWFNIGVFLALLVLAMLCVPTPHSTAQQDNRQLNRDQAQQANGASTRRIALVIGNGAYQNVKPLKNPPNDASLLAATLRTLGFEVTLGTDRSQREMKQLIREFGQRLRQGGGVGLFYFAGHGVQARGHNYLIPVDADIQTEADLEDVAVDVNYVLNMMDDAQNTLNIAVLDACRNNPFARSFRSAQEGLAQVKAPTGTLIAYATAPDSIAADGGGANSPYAEELTKQIQTSGVLLETMFRRVAEQVSARSGGRQEPWFSANVKGDFFFNSSATNSSATNAIPTNPSLSNTQAKIDAVAVEKEYWETIRSSSDAQDYKDYLQAYPNGAYAVVARAKIKQLETAKITPPADSQPTIKQPSNSDGNKPSEPAVAANTSASQPASFKSKQGIEMVYVPPGKYTMGSHADEKETPVHDVTIGEAFYIGKYEVTQSQWQAVMGSNPSNFKDCGSNCPVENVTWNDAQDFIKKLNDANDGYTYRLPSEAEWEYACRAGTTGDYYAGNVDDIGWYKDNSGKKTHAVGSKQPNAFGLYDMSGNVWEWCQDVGQSVFLQVRVMRGGSWVVDATRLRSADRGRRHPGTRHNDFGFRVVAVARTQ